LQNNKKDSKGFYVVRSMTFFVVEENRLILIDKRSESRAKKLQQTIKKMELNAPSKQHH
jgi:hypothetical protein